MNVGEVISAIARCASNFDDENGDYLLMVKSIYSIDVRDDKIYVHFVDGNTCDIIIDKDGNKKYMYEEE